MTIADRITEKLKSAPATIADLQLEGVSASTLNRTIHRLARRGAIRIVGVQAKPAGRRGPAPYLYAVKS